MATFRGKSEDGMGKMLGAGWWEKGKKIVGRVLGSFSTKNGTCYQLSLFEAVEYAGQETRLVAVGALKGFHFAMMAAGVGSLRENDIIDLTCTGKSEQGEGKEWMVMFDLEVTRADS